MSWFLHNTAALLVTLSVATYLSIMAVLLFKLATEEAEVRRQLALPLLPALCQNSGIPIAIAGFAFRETDFLILGSLLIAYGALATSEHSYALHPSLEAPLLVLAVVSLTSVALLRVAT